MSSIVLIFSLLISFSALAKYGQIDNECLKYEQNYVVKGKFFDPDPGEILDRLTGDIDKELNNFSDRPDSQKINCLRQVFEKAKLDSTTYWADRMSKEQCGDESGVPKNKPESCSSETWKELKKGRNNIRSNEVKYAKILDACINSSEDGDNCQNSELQKLASSPIAKDMAKIKSEACCDKQNGAAYQVLKTFYTNKFSGVVGEFTKYVNPIQPNELDAECIKRTMPDQDSLAFNAMATPIECSMNLVQGVLHSLLNFGELVTSLELGMISELFSLIKTTDGRRKLTSILGGVVKSIANQISAQIESTTSCFNNYYKFQNLCRLTTSIITDFMIGGGIGKAIKTFILPLLKGTMKPIEAAAKMMKESKVAKEIASKMKPISEAAGNTKKAVSYSVQRASQAGLAQARAIAIAAKLKMGKPFDNMLSAAIKERYPAGQIAKAAKTSEPPPINGQFKVAEATSPKPSINNTLASSEAKGASSLAASAAGDTASLGTSSLGSSAGKVLRSTVTNKEARSLFGHLQTSLKKMKATRITSEWLDKNIPKNLIPEKYRSKGSLSPSEKVQAYRESLTQIAKIGTTAEKKSATRMLNQLDDLASGTSFARRASGSIATRESLSATEARAASSAENAGKNLAEKTSDIPEVKLSDFVPDPSKLSPSSKASWEELTQQINALRSVPVDIPNAQKLKLEQWNKFGGSQQAQRSHDFIDSLVKKGEIDPEKANSIHRIIADSEQTALNESMRPQFLGTSIVAPNTNPGTFEKMAQAGKQSAKDGYNLVKSNKLGAATYEGTVANSNGRQSEAFDDDTIKNATAEVEKIESNFKSEKEIESFLSKLNSKEQVEDQIDKIKAQISTLLGAPGELSEEHKKELKELMEKLDKYAQKRILSLEKSSSSQKTKK